MSRSKKILSLVLALAMVLGIFSVCSFAAATTPTGTVTLVADNAQVGNSETVTITVKASASETFYAGPMSIPVTFDTTLFTLGTATINDVFGAGVTEKIVNSATAGKVILTVVPKTDGAPVAPDLSASELVIATITFTSDAAATGTGTFAVDADQKSTTNPTGKFYIGSFDGSDPKTAELTTMGQTLNTVPTDVAVGAAEPELILTATGEANGVIIDTHKTFGGAYAGVVYGFPQAATATFRSINYITTNLTTTAGAIVAGDLARTIGTAGYGTGTTITVGSKVYVIVIFGDVTGDGLINVADTTMCRSATSNTTVCPNDSVKRMAANCANVAVAAMMHTINVADTTAIRNYVNGTKFTPADLATRHASFNTRYQ